MLKRLRKKWRIIPVRYKAVMVLLMLAGVSGLVLWGFFSGRPLRAEALRDVFFLPLFMAALLFGLRGGLACVGIIAVTYVIMIVSEWPVDGATLVDLGLELGVLTFTGCVTGILVDRERREARRLREAESLALMGMAAAAVAHELKNPLIAIGGFTQRIHRELEDGHPHKKMLGIGGGAGRLHGKTSPGDAGFQPPGGAEKKAGFLKHHHRGRGFTFGRVRRLRQGEAWNASWTARWGRCPWIRAGSSRSS